jgi:LuxR family maltose regulon positive regulatory protein
MATSNSTQTGTALADYPLLHTKLHIPPRRSDWVRRPHLLEKLKKSREATVILVSAPPGFGKTALLSEWIDQSKIPAAWLSLDPSDNDPARFLRYLISALQSIEKDIGRTALAELQSPQLPELDVLLSNLINDIDALPGRVVLVLDDYHLIDTPKVHGILEFILDHLPPHLYLAIATRADPSLPIARLRAQDQLTEIRGSDLSFNAAESASFLNDSMNLGLSAQDISRLVSRTEGWIAGLQLAAISMRDRSNVSEFIDSFTGDDRHIADYLVEEVLNQQPDRIRDFLLKTSILGSLSASLCDAVTGHNDSQRLLDELDRSNLFITPVDDRRHWYRYHRLFADLLVQRLSQDYSDEMRELHRRAANWLEEHGVINEAIDHTLAAEDFERAIRLMEQHAWAILMRQGEVSTLQRWLQSVPSDIMYGHPRMNIFGAWMLFFSLRIEEIESRLLEVERALETAPDKDVSGELAAVRGSLLQMQGNISAATEQFHIAYESIREDNLTIRAIIGMDLGWTNISTDNLVAASDHLAEAARLNKQLGYFTAALKSGCLLAEVHVAQGHLHQANELYQQQLKSAETWALHESPIMGLLYGGMSELALERNDLSLAADYADKCMEAFQHGGPVLSILMAHLIKSDVAFARGRFQDARSHFQEAEQIIDQLNLPNWSQRVKANQARLWILRSLQNGNEAAQQHIESWVETCNISKTPHALDTAIFLPGHTHDYEHLTLARALIMLNKPQEALDLLGWLLPAAEKAGRERSVVEILILKSVVLRSTGEEELAYVDLERALVLAEPEGYIRLFVNEGTPMAEMLEEMIVRDSEVKSNYLRKLILGLKAPAPAVEGEEPVDPLSDREMEVIKLIEAGLSNTEIAKELFISLDTVKSHTKNINSKLHVHRRTQAVAKARELGLL